MKKIPLEATIGGGYRFLFTNIVSIIGTIWFPALVLVAIIAALIAGFLPAEWLHGNIKPIDNPQAYFFSKLPLFIAAVPVLVLASLLCSAMIRVGILRHALGEATSPTFIYFSLGARVWRMIGAEFLLGFIIAGVVLISALVIGFFNGFVHAMHNVPTAVVVLANIVLVVASLWFFFTVLIRLAFFLPTVVVAENRISIGRAWELGKGNVWRIIVTYLAIVIPISFVVGMIFGIVAPAFIAGVVPQTETHDPAVAIAQLKALLPLLPVLVGLEIVSGIAMAGTMLGAMGFAYKAVTAETPPV